MRTKLKTMLAATGTLHFVGGQTITGLRLQSAAPPQGLSVKSFLIVLVSPTPA
jgi:hypothetical protein